MKKTVFATLFLFLFSISSFAGPVKDQNWYFSSKNQNDRPTLPSAGTASAKGIGADEKVVYLTFDAGYENGNVKKIVDILKEKDVTAAFFVLSHFVKANPELCRQIKENRNLVCNHTAHHPAISFLSPEKIKSELETVAEDYRLATGYEMDPYFRPPEGRYTTEALLEVEKNGYHTVFWSLAWADWDEKNQKAPEAALELLLKRVHNGAVILLHPTSTTNTLILSPLIEELKSRGYRFGSLEELWAEENAP